MKIPDWHNRYQLQARWTINLRRFIFEKLNASPGQTVLDVGAGTGALNDDFKTMVSNLTAWNWILTALLMQRASIPTFLL